MKLRVFSFLFVGASMSLMACSDSDSNSNPATAKTDSEFKTDTVTGMHDSLQGDIQKLLDASIALQKAAPDTAADWTDANVVTMKASWVLARAAYEQVEGALAPIFPNVDASIDERYDGFLADQGKDDNLFDDQGVTGLHAIERILYVKETPAFIVTGEQALKPDGIYTAAAYPATDAEAAEFKSKLCAKLIADAQTFHDQWIPAKIDLSSAFSGLIDLMNEQKEKVNKASSFEEESRYSQRTMADLRDNLEGTKKIYAIFKPWLVTKTSTDPAKDGKAIDTKIAAGFQTLENLYATVKNGDGTPSNALPLPPDGFSAANPSASDLASPFGKLYVGVRDAVDKDKDESVVHAMAEAAQALGIASIL